MATYVFFADYLEECKGWHCYTYVHNSKHGGMNALAYQSVSRCMTSAKSRNFAHE